MDENEQSSPLPLVGCLILLALCAVVLVLGIAGTVVYGATDSANRAAATSVAATATRTALIASATTAAQAAAANDDSNAPADTRAPIAPPATSAAPLPAAAGSAVNRLLVVDAGGQITTVNPDGSDVRALTRAEDRIRYLFPAWSPDSQYIAAVGADPRGPNSGIYILQDNLFGTPQRVAGRPDAVPIYLAWSPDSTLVSFIQARRGTSLLDLQVVPRDASADSRVLATGQPLYWDWTADGSALLINTARSQHAGFAYVPPRDGEVGAAIAQVGRFQSPDISADDRFIAYVEDVGGDDEVVILDRFDGRRVGVEHRGFASLGWSPTQNLLAYLGPTPVDLLPFSGALRLLDTDGNVRLLANDSALAFFWSPDGRYLAYISIASARRPSPEAAVRRAAPPRSVQAQPVQQHSVLTFELWVVDLQAGGARLLATFTPTELFVQQFIPYFDQYARSHTLWAPDSTALALPVFDSGQSVIYRFSVNGERPQPIVAGDIAFWSRR